MTPNEYQTLAMRTEADQVTILDRLSMLGGNIMRLDNAARGLADEVGEVNSCVKKHIEYGQPLDIENLIEEVGDCLWRLAQVAKAGGFSLTLAMEKNIAKLRVRYPEKYTDVLALEENRDRVKEQEAAWEYVPPKPNPEHAVVTNKIHPSQGGCWFCHRDCLVTDLEQAFSIEFDTNFHRKCLIEALKDENDREAKIIAAEFASEK